MVIYDSDKCIWKRDFGYDSLSIKEFDEYASIAVTFVGYFIGKHESVSVEVNRIERKFRFIVEDTLDGFNPIHLSMHRNGNLKTIEAIFHLINYHCSILFAIEDFTPEIPEMDYDGLDSITWYNVFNSNFLLKNNLGFLLKKYDFHKDKGFHMDKEAFRKYLKENGCVV